MKKMKKKMEEIATNNSWRPVVRKSRQIPFGYEADLNDDTILLPIQEQLDALLEAKEYLKSCSYREVSRWLSAKTGRTITYQALHKLMTKERDRQNAVQSYRHYAAKAKEYAEKEKSIQEKILYSPNEKRGSPIETEWADRLLS
jgi:hypothetical protein